MARKAPAPPVDDQLGALIDSQLDIAFDLLLVFGGDDWTHLRVGVSEAANLQPGDLLQQALANRLGHLPADGHDHRHGHAPLAGGAKGPGEDVGNDLVKISVGQDDAVVLRSAHALHALAVARAARVDEFRHSRRADKGHGLDVGMISDCFTDIPDSMHDVEDPRRHAGFEGEFREPNGNGRGTLRRFQDEGIADGDGRGQHPKRDHGGEVEGWNSGDNP